MVGKARGKPPNVAKAMNPLYPAAGDGKSGWHRVARVLGWSLLVALITVIGAAFAIWTGGISLAATQTVVGFLAKEALIGGIEGLLYAGVFEIQRKRAVAQAVAGSVRNVASRPSVPVRRLSMADLENQIKELEAQLQSERQRAGEAVR